MYITIVDRFFCKDCNILKKVSEFELHKNGGPKHLRCNDCKKNKKPRKYNPNSYFKRINKIYGLTEKEYKDMELVQNMKCKICLLPSVNRLFVDHCHKTGKIRGLLCAKCNAGLGQFNDDISILEYAINYLKENSDE